MIRTLIAAIVLATSALAAPDLPSVLSSDGSGGLRKDGKPFRAIGVNYFSCFYRTLLDGEDTSHEQGFEVLAMTTLITMILTPVLCREGTAKALLPLHPFRKRHAPVRPPEDHILVLGFGSAGMWTVKPLRAQGERVLVVDDDAVVCRELTRLGVPVMRGDGSEKAVLDRAGASEAKLVIASMRRVSDALEVLQHVRGVPVIARVFEESDAELIRKAGGIPVMNSDASADTFLEWMSANERIKNLD
jgi:hypothetical protein